MKMGMKNKNNNNNLFLHHFHLNIAANVAHVFSADAFCHFQMNWKNVYSEMSTVRWWRIGYILFFYVLAVMMRAAKKPFNIINCARTQTRRGSSGVERCNTAEWWWSLVSQSVSLAVINNKRWISPQRRHLIICWKLCHHCRVQGQVANCVTYQQQSN